MRKTLHLLYIILLCLIPTIGTAQSAEQLVGKLKQDYLQKKSNLNLSDMGITHQRELFPFASLSNRKANTTVHPLAGFVVYEIKDNCNASEVMRKLEQTGCYEFVEPLYSHHLFDTEVQSDHISKTTIFEEDTFTLNDPLVEQQYYLEKIQLVAALQHCKGDSTLIIGVIDGGFDVAHADLKDKWAYNLADIPDNDIDEDNDGFTDNYVGWNFPDNSSDVGNASSNLVLHGTSVAGVIGAKINNAIGMAGVASDCKMLPLCVGTTSGEITHEYEALVYAVEHGCKVINCSWGRSGGESRYEKAVLDYVVNQKNAVVVAAAGNTHTTSPNYPAAYKDYVLSVGGTNAQDIKVKNTCYGTTLDIVAPSVNICSATPNNTYKTDMSGTSYSSPMVAGAAALVRTQHPEWSALRVLQHLKATADVIDTIAENLQYADLLGSGRLNILRAVSDSLVPNIMVKNVSIYNQHGSEYIYNHDTLYVEADVVNYGEDAHSLTAIIAPMNGIAQTITMRQTIGTLSHDSSTYTKVPFAVIVGENESNDTISIKITFRNGEYASSCFVSTIVNPYFITIDHGNLRSSLTANGRIGFNTIYQGEGFSFNNSLPLFSVAGLVLGNDQSVSDNMYGVSGIDNDFRTLQDIHPIVSPLPHATQCYESAFDDMLASTPFNIETTQRVYAFSETEDPDYLVFEYTLRNKSAVTIPNFHAGLFIDWEISDGKHNRITVDEDNDLVYAYSVGNGVYGGITFLSQNKSNIYAYDGDGTGLSLMFEKPTALQKYEAMLVSRLSAGMNDDGKDVATMTSYGPFSFKANDSLVVAFAIMAGNTPYDIQAAARQAKKNYDYSPVSITSLTKSSVQASFAPNPAAKQTTLSLTLPVSDAMQIDIYNTAGQKVVHREVGELSSGIQHINLNTSSLQTGVYCCHIQGKHTLPTILKLIIK